ncbi:hypothetical protein CK203_070819 [Vitis vinifera]|uniref:DUF7804 domain-containing protein n=1 Tax=Vitis vinifera TaxID=29760 RepID=A0A438E3Z7_VITVI|nr:hypothetical protein CK203_070819 [Vitis vinifera]
MAALGAHFVGVSEIGIDIESDTSGVYRGRGEESSSDEDHGTLDAESVVEIVQNLRGSSSLLAEVYTEGRGGEFTLKIGKAGAEDWPEIKEKWKKGETSSPDGIIVVEELKDEGEEDTKVKKEERFWGLMVQGKGFDCAPCCYVLKTNRPNTNLHISCTYFVLIKVQNFNDSAKSQIDRSFLVE